MEKFPDTVRAPFALPAAIPMLREPGYLRNIRSSIEISTLIIIMVVIGI